VFLGEYFATFCDISFYAEVILLRYIGFSVSVLPYVRDHNSESLSMGTRRIFPGVGNKGV